MNNWPAPSDDSIIEIPFPQILKDQRLRELVEEHIKNPVIVVSGGITQDKKISGFIQTELEALLELSKK